MATRTWNSSSDTDMNDGDNYTPTGDILVGDDLVFDGTSVVNATATASLSVATINALVAYTGVWNDGGQAITVATAFNISNGGNFVATGTTRMTGDGDLTFKNTGSVTTSAWSVDLDGTGNLAFTGYRNMLSLSCAAGGEITTLADGSTLYLRGTAPLSLGTGSLAINANLNLAGSGYSFNQGTATIYGSGSLLFGGGGTNTIYGCAYTGTGNLWIQSVDAGTNVYDLEGNFTSTSNLYLLTQQTSGTTTINSNGNDISAGTTKHLYIGHFVNATATMTYNFGGSDITAGSMEEYTISASNDLVTMNLGVAHIVLHTTVTDADTILIKKRMVFTQSTNGDSIKLMTRSGKITTAGSIMPALLMEESAKTWTLQDNYTSLDGYGSIQITDGTFDTNEKTVVCGHYFYIDAGKAVDFESSVISIYGNYNSGAGSTVTLDATTEFKFYGSAIITNGISMPKTTLYSDISIDDGCTIARLILTAGKTTTFEAGETFTITAYTAGDWDGTAPATFTKIESDTPASDFTVVMPSALAINYIDVTDCESDTHTMTVAFGVDGTGNTNWSFTATVRVWNSSSDTDMNDGSNYHPTGVIDAGDDLVFDGTSVVNATATASLSIATINAVVAYTGIFNDGGQDITVDTAFNMSSGGAYTATGTLTMTGDGDLIVNPTGVRSLTTCEFDVQGTGSISGVANFDIGKLTCAAAGKTTTITVPTILRSNDPLALGGGSLILNMSGIYFAGTGSYTYDQNGTTITGTANFFFQVRGAGETVTIGAFTYEGGITYIESYNTSGIGTYDITGNMLAKGIYTISRAAGAMIFNCGGHDITTSNTYRLTVGQTNGAYGILTINLEGSTFSCGGIIQHSGSTQDDKTIINIADGEFIFTNVGAAGYVSYFYSKVIFTQTTGKMAISTNNGNIFTKGSIMPNIEIDQVGKTVTLQDSFKSLGNLIVTAGAFVHNSQTMQFTEDTIVTTLASALPVCTFDKDFTINDTCTIARLIMTAGKTATFEQGETFTITAYTTGDWNNAILRSTVDSTAFTVVMPSALAMRGVDVKDCTSDTHTMTVTNGRDSTGNTNWTFVRKRVFIAS